MNAFIRALMALLMAAMLAVPANSASIYDWSTTAGDNATADADIDWTELQLPGSVNDSARMMMARIAGLLKDQGGAVASSGTNTVTATFNNSFAAYANGQIVAIKAGGTNTGATTFNANGVGAKAVKKFGPGELALTGGEIQSGGIYLLAYNTALDSSAGAWVLLTPSNSSSVMAVAGSDSAPSITFGGDQDSGLYSSGSNSVSMAIGGTVRTTWSTSGIAATVPFRAVDGSAGNAGYGFVNDNASGMSLVAANRVGIFTGAGQVMSFGSTVVSGVIYGDVSGSSINMVVESNGQIRRSTSAAKYKQDVQPLTDEQITAFLGLNGISYRSTIANDDQDRRHIGIVADQADEAGLTELVSYGATGEVEGFAYDRSVAILLEIVKRQDARIAELEADNDNFEARLEALEAATP